MSKNILVTGLVGINCIALLFLSLWFRCRMLENIPGLNGDEAWYGIKAVDMLRGTPTAWLTPTGNPLNPFFLGPLMLLQCFFGPSIVVLRVVAVASGLLALILNWLLCRWVFDGRMAWISTAALAVLPIDIAYSRFAWDASQSLAAALPVIYFALASIRFRQWKLRLITAAAICQVIAVIVHPTNIFTATVILAALAAQWKSRDSRSSFMRILMRPTAIIIVLIACILAGVWIVWLAGTPMPHWLGGRFREMINSNDTFNGWIYYARLFTGGTIYRYIAGSHSWMEWPLPFDREGYGVDVFLFWALILAAGTILWRSWKRSGRTEDGVLLASWVLTLSAFLLVAGPRAMSPGNERFAICLIAPTVILLSRAFALAWSWNTSAGRIMLPAAMILGWLMLADFHVHYFRFIEKTGGQAHLTFRTAAEEPKSVALKYILENRMPGETLIVSSRWWNLCPLKYLGMSESELRVLTSDEAEKTEPYSAMKKEGRVWFVEFSGSEELHKIEAQLAGYKSDRHEIDDYGGRSILTVLHPQKGLRLGD